MLKSVILAAGKGTRMKSETPKVLHKIFDKTLLGYVLDSVKSFSNEAFVIVGHKAEEVTEFVNKNYSFAKTVLQTPQLGTGHAVSMVCPNLEDYDGLVLILCGDTPLVRESTMKKFVDEHIKSGADLTVMSTIFDNPTNYGRIIRFEDGSLDKIVEEKDATLEQKAVKEVNAGIYCLNWAKIKPAFSQLTSSNAQGEYYLTDIIEWANRQKFSVKASVLKDSNEIYGINSRENLASATKLMNDRKLKELMISGVTIVDPNTTWISQDTEIGSDTIVFPNTYIEGANNKIGKNCKIGPFAHLRPNSRIADDVKIGNFVEIKNSTIGEKTSIAHLTYIGDSDVGARVNFGCGCVTVNYDGIKKSRTVVGDDCFIGCNTNLVAPVKVESGSYIAAGSTITDDVSEDALAIARARQVEKAGWAKEFRVRKEEAKIRQK